MTTPLALRAGVAGEILERAREVDQLAHRLLGLVGLAEVGADALGLLARLVGHAQRVVQRDVQRPRRDGLGDAVDVAVAHAQHAPGVAQHRLGRHGAVGDDLADLVAAVAAGHVVDHLVAAVHAEVDVEVRHRHAFGIEEALEQELVAQRVEVGDAQRPGHQRAGARAATRADRDALAPRPVDEVGDDQEVAGETHAHDDVEFEREALVVVARATCPA